MHYQCQGLARVLSNDCMLSTNQSFYRYASEDSIEALSFCLFFVPSFRRPTASSGYIKKKFHCTQNKSHEGDTNNWNT